MPLQTRPSNPSPLRSPGSSTVPADLSRRTVLRAGLAGLSLAGVAGTVPALLGVAPAASAAPTSWVHPGIGVNQADLDRMSAKATISPWSDGLAAFRAQSTASSSYGYAAQASVGSAEETRIRNDSAAAHQNALLWAALGETAHRDRAIAIIDAWSSTLTSFDSALRLTGGIAIHAFANAAELLAHSGSGWTGKDAAVAMLRDTIYPAIAWTAYTDGNQGNTTLAAMIALAVLTEDADLFDFVTNGLQTNTCSATGSSSGITGYILSSGQLAESGRDQTHALGGYAWLATAVEIAYKQGVDLYSFAGRRMLAGFEYHAKYNLGNDVDYTTFGPCSASYSTISATGRGVVSWAPAELVYAAYRNRQHYADGVNYTTQYRNAIGITSSTWTTRLT